MDGLRHVLRDAALMEPIRCVDMHTTGEPTRIVYSGFPKMLGTLLEQREQASRKYDHIRRRLLLEPRGHWDMYGAILIQETELVANGKADIGVLFMHNAGFSMMCGHATLALGRFLVDTHEEIFPQRRSNTFDSKTCSVQIKLHIPSGILELTVPLLPNGQSDPCRPVSFLSVPSFCTGLSVTIPLSIEHRWPELGNRTSITADFSYGGAFYCLVDAEELGFPGGLAKPDLAKMNFASKMVKDAVNTNPDLSSYVKHPDLDEAGYLYSIMIVDARTSYANSQTNNSTSESVSLGEETGLCFFANQQIDRSPTGGCVAARIALANAKGCLQLGEKRTYHSLLSRAYSGFGGFTGSVAEVLPQESIKLSRSQDSPLVRVRVEGQAFYVGAYTAVIEEVDRVGKTGFSLNNL